MNSSVVLECLFNVDLISGAAELIDCKMAAFQSDQDLNAVELRIGVEGSESLGCALFLCKCDECLAMGAPDEPLEFDVLLSTDLIGDLLLEGPHVHDTVKVIKLMEAVVEVVVVALGVEVDDSRLAEAACFGINHHDVLHWHDVLK